MAKQAGINDSQLQEQLIIISLLNVLFAAVG
jgi:hypothetical protein